MKARTPSFLVSCFVVTCVVLSSLFLITPGVGGGLSVYAASPSDYVLLLSAETSESPAKIRLHWPAGSTQPDSYKVYRRAKDSGNWGNAVATLSGGAVSYEDTNVVVGQTYEYWIAGGQYGGHILAGIKVPAVESRGKVVLLVEAEQATALRVELETLTKDLIGDGWTVLRHDVSRNATPQQAKALIQKDYNADSANVRAVFLLGHIPVFKSGNIMPDGHGDHRGAWPADAYYGTMTASWDNSPSSIPGEVQLQVGRVDLDNMPAFQKNATELLRQYLNKDHRYRIGQMTTTRDAFISDGFGTNNKEYFALNNAWTLFPTLWGPNARIDEGSCAQYLLKNTYTWGHINGPGGYTSAAAAGGTLRTSDLAAQNYGIIFCQTMGSYFGDWDRQNNFMRAFLAMSDYGLTNAWTGRPHWFFHHMAMGETVGYSARLTQNNYTIGYYMPSGFSPNMVHIALMGDPTLRMFPVRPASNLRTTVVSGGTSLQWTASADSAVTDYYIYGASHPEGPYTRLGIVKGTTWTHKNPGNTKHYMVRASKLTKTGSGSFYNLSQGVMSSVGKADDQGTVTDNGDKTNTPAGSADSNVNKTKTPADPKDSGSITKNTTAAPKGSGMNKIKTATNLGDSAVSSEPGVPRSGL